MFVFADIESGATEVFAASRASVSACVYVFTELRLVIVTTSIISFTAAADPKITVLFPEVV